MTAVSVASSTLTSPAAEPDALASVTANIHVREDSAISVTEHAEDARVVLEVGCWPASANLFLDVADLDRLIAALRESRDRLYDPEPLASLACPSDDGTPF
jgi:hypothetical protein